jgi:predicted dehydrogenase
VRRPRRHDPTAARRAAPRGSGLLDGYVATQAHFLAGLLRGIEHETSGAETLKTMDILWAGYRSAGEGRTIEL